MNKYYYQKPSKLSPLFFVRLLGFFLFIIGITTVVYVFSPLLIWQLTLAPEIADAQILAPVPNRNVLTPGALQSLISASFANLSGNSIDASTWFPGYTPPTATPKVSAYFLSIPKLGITNAYVSTTDSNLAAHLVNLAGSGVPPDKGNSVIFGHSTLPQLYQSGNYKTIFANLYKMQVGDIFQTTVNNILYTYTIFSITVVDPEDTSVLAQQYDDSYLTVITCTPPGTIWKRLILKARLEKLTE